MHMYESPKFNNGENECVTLADGRTVWLSRSSAVVGLFVIDNRVLMVKRGPGCPDEVGKWVLPCGYLDRNETLLEGMIRETYEETGFNLIGLQDYLIDSHAVIEHALEEQPFFTRSQPGMDKKQNVSHYFRLIARSSVWHDPIDIPLPNLEKLDAAECESVAWLTIPEIKALHEHNLIGFKHYDVVWQNIQ